MQRLNFLIVESFSCLTTACHQTTYLASFIFLYTLISFTYSSASSFLSSPYSAQEHQYILHFHTAFILPSRFPAASRLTPRGGRRCSDVCQSLHFSPCYDRGGAAEPSGRVGQGEEGNREQLGQGSGSFKSRLFYYLNTDTYTTMYNVCFRAPNTRLGYLHA